MRDEMDLRMWNAHHGEFRRGLDGLMEAFRRLASIQYAAPWAVRREECKG